MQYNLIFKEYKNGSCQIKKFKHFINCNESNFNNAENKVKRILSGRVMVPQEIQDAFGVSKYAFTLGSELEEQKKKEKSLKTSYSRTISNITDLVRNNDWEYFFTFTLDKNVIDRYNYDECSRTVRKFVSNLKNRYANDLQYIIVPEMHSDGAYHFHGMFNNLPASCLSAAIDERKYLDDGRENKYYGKQIKKKGKLVYNLNYYHLGFTTLTKIDDLKKTCSYILKYITKELCSVTKNKRRYYNSHDLSKPVRQMFSMSEETYNYMIRYFKKLNKNISYTKEIIIDVPGFSSAISIVEFDNENIFDELYEFACIRQLDVGYDPILDNNNISSSLAKKSE